MRKHDVGSHGKLDGRRADSLPRLRRGAQRRRHLGVSKPRSATPIRKSLPSCRHPTTSLPRGGLPECGSTPAVARITAATGSARTRSSMAPFASAESSSRNGSNEPVWFDGRVTVYQGDHMLSSGTFAYAAKPLSKYDGDMEPCRFPSQPSDPSRRDTFARIVVVDRQSRDCLRSICAVLASRASGERDWLKHHFAKEFVFQIGPYPTSGRSDRLPQSTARRSWRQQYDN